MANSLTLFPASAIVFTATETNRSLVSIFRPPEPGFTGRGLSNISLARGQWAAVTFYS